MIELQTERLHLRNVRAEDLACMYAYRNSELCLRYQRGQNREKQKIADLIDRRKDDAIGVEAPFMLAVALRENDEMVGEIVVIPKEGTITVGYSFHPAHHQKGYAFEALSFLIDQLHDAYPDWEFISFTDPVNEPSMSLLKKLGYADMGYLASKDSRVFGKWLQPGTYKELEQAVSKTMFQQITDRELLDKGWSVDKKYRVTTEDGGVYLLRIAPEERKEQFWRSYVCMQKVEQLGAPMCRPVEYGHCPEGVYALQSWIDGMDAESCIPALAESSQYAYGLDAGRLLKQIHSIPAPENAAPWAERFGAKIDRKIVMYRSCPLQYDNGDLLLEFLEKNRHLLTDRPQTCQHGDYHIGNMMVDREGKLTVIDFDKADHGDPWEEFNRIVWSAQASALFATGMVDGYFDGEVPMDFWRLLALYICSNTLGSLPWAIPFGQQEIDVMYRQAAQVLAWYDQMRSVVPTWYSRP